MVKKVKRKGEVLYVCEVCGLAYEEKKWAEKCQEWCQEHESCNLEIIEHAVPLNEMP